MSFEWGRKTFCIFCVAMICSMILSRPLVAADNELRTWTDITGKYKMPARFVKVANGIVFLKGEKGEDTQIPLAGLSLEDQAHIKTLLKEAESNPFKATTPAPSVSSSPAPAPTPTPAPAESSAPEKPVEMRNIKPNFSGMRIIDPATGDSGWKISIAAPEPEAPIKLQNINLPGQRNPGESINGLVINHAAKHAAVGYITNHHNEPKPFRLIICDLTTFTAGPPVLFPRKLTPLALRNDGREVVLTNEAARATLEIWSIDGARATPKASLIANPEQRPERVVNWAEFVSDSMLATHTTDGELFLWTYPGLQPMVSMKTASDVMPDLSPDRKYIAISTNKTVALFDVARKRIVAQQPHPKQSLLWPKFAFSPSGNQLAAASNGRVFVWNTSTGDLTQSIQMPNNVGTSDIYFCDEKYAMVSQRYLVDVEKQLSVWSYEGVRSSVGARSVSLMVPNLEGSRGSLIVGQLPHEKAVESIKTAMNNPDLYALQPGSVVSINVAGIPDAGARERILANLTAKVKEIGCTVDPSGSIELLAAIDGPKEKEMSFRTLGAPPTFPPAGPGPRGEVVKVKVYTSLIKFNYQGVTLWEQGTSSLPHIFDTKANEDLRTSLQRYEQPNYGYYDNIQIPGRLQRPIMENGRPVTTFGKSTVSASGVQ